MCLKNYLCSSQHTDLLILIYLKNLSRALRNQACRISIQYEKISRTSAKNALHQILKTGKSVADVISELDLGAVSNKSELSKIIKEVIASEPEAVEQAKSNPQTINYLVGKIMQKTKGKADPKLSLDLLKKQIG